MYLYTHIYMYVYVCYKVLNTDILFTIGEMLSVT